MLQPRIQLEEGGGDGAGVGDMSDGHLQAAAVVRDLVEVPFLDPPRRRLDRFPVVLQKGPGGVSFLSK